MNIGEVLESIIRYARIKLQEEVSQMDDKTNAIACAGLFPVYVQKKYHSVGEVARHPKTGSPKECILAYDGSVQSDWTIDTPTLWKPWHSQNLNMLCRMKHRLGHTICINPESI